MDFLVRADQNLFLLINGLPHGPFPDYFFLLISQSIWLVWPAFFVYILSFIFVHKKNAGRGFVFLVLATLSGFILNTYGFKDFFHRDRPFVSLSETILVQKDLTDFSFPSGHAFSVALLATLFIRRRRIFRPLSVYALLVGFSRVYLGAHYPLDVLSGFAFGIIYGVSVDHFYGRFLEEEEFHILKHHIPSDGQFPPA